MFDLSVSMVGIHLRSTSPFLQTQESPLRMQRLTLSLGFLIPDSSNPDLAPGLSPSTVVKILTWPSINSDVHPSESLVDTF